MIIVELQVIIVYFQSMSKCLPTGDMACFLSRSFEIDFNRCPTYLPASENPLLQVLATFHSGLCLWKAHPLVLKQHWLPAKHQKRALRAGWQ